ncbi:hypothetical protein [Chryseobacterium sp. T16E-39]|uniref:hypothetical protein n=1 Tax=Chryseobacterium sp. T16E-39 TaxID=2015076 RepID=UPI0012F8AC8A|nr:hypothetical protein [Chryseobacterium sp. T16E-39]
MKKQHVVTLLASGMIFSQVIQDLASKNVEDVVVLASGKPTKIFEIPGTVGVVQKEKIQEQVKSGVPIKEMLYST